MDINEQRSTLTGYGFQPTVYQSYAYAMYYGAPVSGIYPIIYAEDSTNNFVFFVNGVQINTGKLSFLDTLIYVRLAIARLNVGLQIQYENFLLKVTNAQPLWTR